MAVSERTFGVEIECTYGARPTKKSDVYQRIGWGDRDPMRRRAIEELKAHKEFKRWADNIGIDGSGIEIRSPVLKGQEGIEELAAFFDYLIEIGSTVTNQDGMHVHHGAKDFHKDHKLLFNACSSWGVWTPTIHKLVAKRRRNGGMCHDAFNNKEVIDRLHAFCFKSKEDAAIAKKYRDALNRYYNGTGAWPRVQPPQAQITDPANIGGRGAFNLGNLRERDKCTIEIRLAEGMMDRDAAVAWVKFGQSFLDKVATTGEQIEAPAKQTVDALLDAVGLDDDAKEVLKAKAKNRGNAPKNPAPGKIANGVTFDESEDDE